MSHAAMLVEFDQIGSKAKVKESYGFVDFLQTQVAHFQRRKDTFGVASALRLIHDLRKDRPVQITSRDRTLESKLRKKYNEFVFFS